MCLAIPGEIISIEENSSHKFLREGKVRFGVISKKINLTFVPDAQIGDFVIVHVGVALSIVDKDKAYEAARLFNMPIGNELYQGGPNEVSE